MAPVDISVKPDGTNGVRDNRVFWYASSPDDAIEVVSDEGEKYIYDDADQETNDNTSEGTENSEHVEIPKCQKIEAKKVGGGCLYAQDWFEHGTPGMIYVAVSTDGNLVQTESIGLSDTTLCLDVGEYHELSATVSPSNATVKNVKWVSENPNIATVTTFGRIKAIAPGTTTIRAEAMDGSGVCACCEVTCNISCGTDSIGVFRTLAMISPTPGNTEAEAPAILGVQFTEPQNGNYRIRFVSQIKNLHYKELGYEIHSKFGDNVPVSNVFSSKVVYRSLIAAGETVYPSEGFNYFVVCVIENIPENTVASFKIVPYAITLEGAYLRGNTTLFSCKDAQKIDYVSFGVSENVEYHLLCNGDNEKALRVCTGKKFQLAAVPAVKGERKSYWKRQKWVLKSVGDSKKLFTQLNNYYLCNNGSNDAYVSKSASDSNSNIVIIPCANNSELNEIKLANYDLYLTLEYNSSDKCYLAKWRPKDASNSSNQVWQFVEQPANLHNGVDTGAILKENTVQALESDNTEFVIRYYKILDTLKGVELFTKGSTSYNGQTMSTIDATILKLREKGIDLDVENYLEYADTIPLNDDNLYITGNGKSLITDEKKLYETYNINIVSVYQNDGTQYEYFTEKHAKLDALSALMSAKILNQPCKTTIYFAVDFDIEGDTDKDNEGVSKIERIKTYFEIVKNKLGGRYKIGVYGSGYVCSAIKPSYAQYSWLGHSIGHYGYEEYDDTSKYNIKQAETYSCNGTEVDDDIAVCSDYGQWYL
jgi:hypothetical protein